VVKLQNWTVAIEDIVLGLESAWNHSDGLAYASHFEEDADFVNVYGMHGKGRHDIGKAHDMIFRTIYAGSVIAVTLKNVRMLVEDIVLAHLDIQLWVPQGPLQGQLKALPSLVVRRQARKNQVDKWLIASLHNTLVVAPPPLPDNVQALN
jgi:uncharacterized protein (TIGR02246 family)